MNIKNKLLTLGSNHKYLDLTVGELSTLKDATKSQNKSKHAVAQYQAKWAEHEAGPAETDVSLQLRVLHQMMLDLEAVHLDSIRESAACFKEISGASLRLDSVRSRLKEAEGKEEKARKKSATNTDGSAADIAQYTALISRLNEEMLVAGNDLVGSRVREMKRHLLLSAEANIKLCGQLQIIYEAQKQLALQLPEPEAYVHNQVYSGTAVTERIVQDVRVQLKEHNDFTIQNRHSGTPSGAAGGTIGRQPPPPPPPGFTYSPPTSSAPQTLPRFARGSSPNLSPNSTAPPYNPFYEDSGPPPPGYQEGYIGGENWNQGRSMTLSQVNVSPDKSRATSASAANVSSSGSKKGGLFGSLRKKGKKSKKSSDKDNAW